MITAVKVKILDETKKRGHLVTWNLIQSHGINRGPISTQWVRKAKASKYRASALKETRE
jgi:hypothetical protein